MTTIASQLQPILDALAADGVPLAIVRKAVETGYIEAALRRSDQNQTKAARLLGVHRNTVNGRLRERHTPEEIRELRLKERTLLNAAKKVRRQREQLARKRSRR